MADAGAGDWQRRHAAAGPAGVDVWSRPVAGSPMLLTLGRIAFAGVSAPALLRVFASQDGYDLIDPYAEDHSAAVRAVWRDDAAGRVELCQTVSKPPCPREFLTLNQARFLCRTVGVRRREADDGG